MLCRILGALGLFWNGLQKWLPARFLPSKGHHAARHADGRAGSPVELSVARISWES